MNFLSNIMDPRSADYQTKILHLYQQGIQHVVRISFHNNNNQNFYSEEKQNLLLAGLL